MYIPRARKPGKVWYLNLLIIFACGKLIQIRPMLAIVKYAKNLRITHYYLRIKISSTDINPVRYTPSKVPAPPILTDGA